MGIDYISADFIIEPNAQVWLIEGNSVAIGAPSTDEGFFDDFFQDIRLVRDVANFAIVMPQSLSRLFSRTPTKEDIRTIALDVRYGGPLSLAANDIIQILNAAERLRLSCECFDRDSIQRWVINNRSKTCVLWFSKESCSLRDVFLINRSIVRTILDDKLLFCKLLSRLPLCSFSIVPTAGATESFKFMPLGRPSSGFTITKPRFGFGSIDLIRTNQPFTSVSVDPDGNSIAQPWIEPARVKHGSHDYYYDVRCIGWSTTRSPGVFIRICSFPVTLQSFDSCCSWLPTSGYMHEWSDLKDWKFLGPSALDVRSKVETAFKELLAIVGRWQD